MCAGHVRWGLSPSTGMRVSPAEFRNSGAEGVPRGTGLAGTGLAEFPGEGVPRGIPG